jgi:hypothetical protein
MVVVVRLLGSAVLKSRECEFCFHHGLLEGSWRFPVVLRVPVQRVTFAATVTLVPRAATTLDCHKQCIVAWGAGNIIHANPH